MIPQSRPDGERGEASWTIPGTYIWIVPANVFTVSAVVVGAGSSGNTWASADKVWGGAAGGLAYKNGMGDDSQFSGTWICQTK